MRSESPEKIDTVEVVVTATNAAGSTSATSSPTSVVEGLLPSNTKAPSILGNLLEGQVLSAEPGSWSGTEPISYAAGRMGSGLNQAYDAAHRGEIPVIRVGKRLHVLVEPFERMLPPATVGARQFARRGLGRLRHRATLRCNSAFRFGVGQGHFLILAVRRDSARPMMCATAHCRRTRYSLRQASPLITEGLP